MKDNTPLEMEIADTIMERPNSFSMGGRQFYLYPPTLGKIFLVERIMKELEWDDKNISINPYMEAIRLCEEKKDIVCRLISYHTFYRKKEIFNPALIAERINLFKQELSTEEMAQLLIMLLPKNNVPIFLKHYGIDKEKETQRKIARLKKGKDNTITFGGKSIYGSLIDAACERYGWTMEYVVWGISYDNLQMLLSDITTSVYLSDDEMKKMRIPKTFISGDNPENMAKILAMNWD